MTVYVLTADTGIDDVRQYGKFIGCFKEYEGAKAFIPFYISQRFYKYEKEYDAIHNQDVYYVFDEDGASLRIIFRIQQVPIIVNQEDISEWIPMVPEV